MLLHIPALAHGNNPRAKTARRRSLIMFMVMNNNTDAMEGRKGRMSYPGAGLMRDKKD
jgi:hypothetical protein